ncbi:ATP-binding cassette domain-containing protein [Enterococcus columbae]|uniref:ABC transporter domain-containing protein n=1 Tax=Enterococcus columbae DSM 7374 = ATCC 51263 TaxID=1121865 RepID=S0KI88_9ENTE|nr:ATP-binding cassette domain-containing protein [Enterococcus columbae]EOT44559.1 hypothetical protein OMW_00615 [Enterococcus columbae DSM 7374 = ATCC 51263]EOW87545.1 hypothetical protein I568_00589 [Enterococcus columbae DSM 7374 = ATCC 51263]OJG25202.1 hypothetical protein RR47_GL001990 [Enterococcus columbae DSM 7374 = ATCC 51263]
MSIGTLITFNSYTTLIFSPLSKILTIPTNISQLNASIERIETNVLPTSFVHNGTFAKEKLEDDQIISIHNYLPFVENTALFTRPLSVCFKKGYIYRIIGRNGIGKSLFLQSIIQYYTNYSGNILVSKDSSISYVPQENFLFDGTIKDNLTKGLSNYDEQDLYNFMNLFNCKLKLNQEVHSYSLKLSSGELQKIKLIRALLSKPDIILLDEVFANMDQTTIQTLIDYLLANNLTTIFIYHGELSSEIDNLNFQIINLNKYTDGE